ncbi:MAG: PotD/PotF family extracellular solute-binding protein [Dongiaceae bacterium]
MSCWLRRLLLLVTVVVGCGWAGVSPRAAQVTLNYLGWYDETIAKVLDEFEAKYHIKVNYKNFESNEEAFNIMRSDPTAWDLVAGDGYWPQRYFEQGLTQEFDPAGLSSWGELYPAFQKFASTTWAGKTPGRIVAYPGTWGNYQVTVLSGKVGKRLESWKDLWDPAYRGRILISGQGNEMLALTALSLGTPLKSVYDLSAEQLGPVTERLIALKPNIRKIYANVDEIGALMKQQDAWIALTWSAAMANALTAQGIAAEAYVPGGKTVGWVNCVMVTAGTEHRAEALQFLDFLYSKGMREVRWKALQVGDHVAEANRAFVEDLKANGEAATVAKLDMEHPEAIFDMELFKAPKDLDAYVNAWNQWMAAP